MNTVVLGSAGAWGKKIVERLEKSSNYNLIAVVDPLDTNVSTFHSWEVFKEHELFEETELVCIFTPPGSHYELAKDAILNGKHVICAKPIVSTYKEIKELYDLAEQRGVALLMEYTFLFNSAILKLKEFLPLIGTPKLMHSRRMNFGKHQEYGVVADLLPHDISIAHYLFGDLKGDAFVQSNSALGAKDFAHVFIKNKTPDIDVTLGWSSPKRDRELYIAGERGILSVLWDSNEVEFTKVHKQKEASREIFNYVNDDAITKEFEAFAELFKNNNYKETMKTQQKTTELICQFLETAK